MDEVSLTKGELYTYVTNKAARGRKGTLVASIQGTRSKDIIEVLKKIPLQQRLQVKEGTVDMAASMSAAVRAVFPNALLVFDRFHVGQLASDVVQRVRIKYRWKELDRENKARKAARRAGEQCRHEQIRSGGTRRRPRH